LSSLRRRKKLGRKVHPTGFRVGIIRDWQAKWYADRNYLQLLQEDLKLRRAIRAKYAGAGISLVEIDRQGDKISVNIHTARPGVVIGRGGQRVDEMRQYLEALVGSKVQLNIQEIRQPELDAYLVAVTVAEQMERRVAYRRAMKQSIFRTIEAGAKGMRISCSGRLAGAEIARREVMHQGQVPLQKLRADIDYGFAEARTTLGRIGVKVWIYKGDILPEAAIEEAEEAPPVAAEAGVEELVEAVEAAPVAEVAPAAEKEPAPKKKAEAEAVEAAPAAERKPARKKKAEAEAVEEAHAAEEKPARKKKAEVEAVEVAPAAEKKPAPKKKAEAEAVEDAPAAEEKPARKKKAEAGVAEVAPAAEKKPAPKKKAEAAEVAPAAEKKPARKKKAEAEAVEVAPAAEKKPAPKKKAEAAEVAPAVEKKPTRKKKAEAAEVAPAVEKKPTRKKKADAAELEGTDATTEAS
jgi:small subunit ribosomal protein S3